MPDPTPGQAPAQPSSQPATQAQPQPAAQVPHPPNPAPASTAVKATAPAPAQTPSTPPKAPVHDTPQTANKLDVPQTAAQPARAPVKSDKDEKPLSLHQKLADIRARVEAAANSRVFDGKAEAFQDAWDDLDAIGSSDKPHEAAMIQAAHNHLQHHAPRRASEIDSLEAQLDAATEEKPRPQAVPDSPQLANVKARIAALQTDLARDPRALPGDVERAQALQERVDAINAEKATAGAR